MTINLSYVISVFAIAWAFLVYSFFVFHDSGQSSYPRNTGAANRGHFPLAVKVEEESIPIESPKFWVPPLTNIKEWLPPTDADPITIGSKVNGMETIFMVFPSYRDILCSETITSAFSRAEHPGRLFVGVVEQSEPADKGCLDITVPCSADPNQAICKYRNQISVYHMDAHDSTGPVTSRHFGDQLYRGEYFVMQTVSHVQFVRHWDSHIIEQWRETGNEMAVLRLAAILSIRSSNQLFLEVPICRI